MTDARTPSPSSPHSPHSDVDCKRAMQKLWDFLDQELTDTQMAAVRAHLECCSACFPHKAWAERFLHALHSLRDEELMPPELKARVIERLRAAGFAGTE